MDTGTLKLHGSRQPRYLTRTQLSALFVIISLWSLLLPRLSDAALTPDEVEFKIERIKKSPELDESTQTKLIETLTNTIGFLKEADSKSAEAKQFAEAARTAPKRAQSLQADFKRLERNPGKQKSHNDKNKSIDSLKSELLAAETFHNNLSAEISRLEAQIAQAKNQPKIIRNNLTKIFNRQVNIDSELASSLTATSGSLEEQIQRWELEAEQKALSARQESLEQELLSFQTRMQLKKIQLSIFELQLRTANSRTQTLQELLSKKRVESAQKTEQTLTQQEQQFKDEHILLQQLAAKNTELSKQSANTSEQFKKVEADTQEAATKTLELSESFRNTQLKIEIAGLSKALGQILLEEKRRLPNANNIKASSPANDETIAEAGLRQIRHEEERRGLRDINAYVKELTKNLDNEIAQSLEPELIELAEQRRELLNKAIEIDQAYVRALGELDFILRKYLAKANSYNEFLTEHLLWIRSSPAVNASMLGATGSQLLELFLAPQIKQLIEDAKRWSISNLGYWLLVLALIVFASRHTQLRTQLTGLSEPMQRLTTDRYMFTLKALILTLLHASVWPLILFISGHAIASTAEISSLTSALANALSGIAIILFSFSFLRKMCLPDGLAIAHFKWPKQDVNKVYKDLGRFLFIFIPIVTAADTVMNYQFEASTGALPHIALALATISFGYCAFRLINKKYGAMTIYHSRIHKTESNVLQKALVSLSILVPCALSVAALMGYLYTAATLSLLLLTSILSIASLINVHQLIIRWLVLTQRKMAYKNAIERRDKARQKRAEQSKAEQANGEQSSAPIESIEDAIEEPQVDLNALSRETKELINTLLFISSAIILWLIWKEILPALGILEDIEVWENTQKVGDKEQLVPVTLFSLTIAVLIVILTFLVAKRLPALLEFTFLQRMQLSAGGRYTIRTLSGYTIVAIGVLSALSSIGASWSQVQWLVAALGVGIGFGLQEIVANFISGLIILFERPIRVGDIVTVGETDGVVTKIKIRATTIRNWDQKELLVPNKEFITNRLLNWSLSDQTMRLLVQVGVAYGSDVRKAMDIIIDIAKQHPHVIDDPAPAVTFESLGDNALILYLRAYINNLDHRLPTTTDLNLEVYERLNEAGIVIAFPQRDVHLHTAGPLDVRMAKESSMPAQSN